MGEAVSKEKMKTAGKVWLVGAGPGDGELLTLKGARVLRQADAVVYDALAGMAALSWVPPEAELIYAGKRAGNHAMSQDAINACLAELAAGGKRVVRLKGGDPFLFGRGGEELQYLKSRGISCEVVPGVSSALAVPEACGIPVTHRSCSDSVHIITGHKKEGSRETVDYKALCKSGGTFVFLMGAGRLGEICRGFMEAGMEPDTPAAMLSHGTLAAQRKVVASISTLERAAEEAGLAAPAIIVIGSVCLLAESLEWMEQLPLFGSRVILTAPAGRGDTLAFMLREKGAEVLELPAVRLEGVNQVCGSDCTSEDCSCGVDAATEPGRTAEPDKPGQEDELGGIEEWSWLVFTSPSGVDFFFGELERRRMDLRRLHGIRLAALGKGTAARLESRGLYADLIPGAAVQEALGSLLLERLEPGARVLLLRAAEGREVLPTMLGERKDIRVKSLILYHTVYEERNAGIFRQLRGGGQQAYTLDRERPQEQYQEQGRDIWVFTSSLGVKAAAHAIGEQGCMGLRAACIGELTGKTASRLGMQARVAESASPESLARLVEEMSQERGNG